VDLRIALRDSSLKFFAYYKSLGERALAQLRDDELHWTPAPEGNSAAVIVQHMAGNMVSRWTGFPDSDGESTTRDREAEFVDAVEDRAALMMRWERGWHALFAALERLAPEDWARTVRIRGETISVIEAVQRQIAHYAYHVGQLVLLARMQRGEDWQSLSIPRGNSAQFNAAMLERHTPKAQ
jgi:hypothetical protein